MYAFFFTFILFCGSIFFLERRIIMENYDLKLIKDKYGEKMMHLCRSIFPTLLDNSGMLFQVLSDTFAYSKYLYDDLVNNNMVVSFTEYINSKYKLEYDLKETDKMPEELLASVGYKLYKCDNRYELDKFRKYYRKDEELCTFAVDKFRTHHIFFIVKDNAELLNREDFTNPSREDEYSTSVLGIQFGKGNYNRVSIKSRYNHTVNNPDATYYNNLENIVPGLTKSFEKKYKFNITGSYNAEFELPGYVKANDGRYYKYNYKMGSIYYCVNNIIIYNGRVIDAYNEKEKFIIMDYYILDLMNKRVFLYESDYIDSFPDTMKDIDKIEVINDKLTELKRIYITQKENFIVIYLNKYNQIIAYHNECIDKIGNNFMIQNTTLKEISLPNVKKVGNYFLGFNRHLERLYAPNLRKIGDSSLLYNQNIFDVELPKLKIKKRKKVLSC